VNVVAPGVIATEMSSFTETEGGREFALGMQALKRIGQADDVADVIAFLASDKARWITGVNSARRPETLRTWSSSRASLQRNDASELDKLALLLQPNANTGRDDRPRV